MKAVFINGSPRKNWNTHKLLVSAMEGAKEAGAETALYNLYDLSFTGCRSCFACKLKDARTHGVCAWNDDLKPVLQDVMEADVLVLGTPVYFGNVSAQMNLFIERMKFPIVTYRANGPWGNVLDLPKEKKCGMIITMGCPEELKPSMGYKGHFDAWARSLGNTLGDRSAEVLYSCDTYQFEDYSKYAVDRADPGKKGEHREKQFPIDMQKAREMGMKLCK